MSITIIRLYGMQSMQANANQSKSMHADATDKDNGSPPNECDRKRVTETESEIGVKVQWVCVTVCCLGQSALIAYTVIDVKFRSNVFRLVQNRCTERRTHKYVDQTRWQI